MKKNKHNHNELVARVFMLLKFVVLQLMMEYLILINLNINLKAYSLTIPHNIVT